MIVFYSLILYLSIQIDKKIINRLSHYDKYIYHTMINHLSYQFSFYPLYYYVLYVFHVCFSLYLLLYGQKGQKLPWLRLRLCPYKSMGSRLRRRGAEPLPRVLALPTHTPMNGHSSRCKPDTPKA